jgi:hypothetical protein
VVFRRGLNVLSVLGNGYLGSWRLSQARRTDQFKCVKGKDKANNLIVMIDNGKGPGKMVEV